MDNVHSSDDFWRGWEIQMEPIWPDKGKTMSECHVIAHKCPADL